MEPATNSKSNSTSCTESEELEIYDKSSEKSKCEDSELLVPVFSKLQDHVKLDEIGALFDCFLCSKTISHARTITECMHSFCRSCITDYLSSSRNLTCPICGFDLGFMPKDIVKPDKSLQSLLKRIFPEVPQDVDEDFSAKCKRKEEDEGFGMNKKLPKLVTFELNPIASLTQDSSSEELAKRFVRVSKKATILQLQKFLELKLKIPMSNIIIYLQGNLMKSEWSMEYVSKFQWKDKQSSPIMVLSYGMNKG